MNAAMMKCSEKCMSGDANGQGRKFAEDLSQGQKGRVNKGEHVRDPCQGLGGKTSAEGRLRTAEGL